MHNPLYQPGTDGFDALMATLNTDVLDFHCLLSLSLRLTCG